jgi:hypothetical protein
MAVSQRPSIGLLELLRRIFCRLASRLCPPEPPPPPPPPRKERPVYFGPGQLSVLVEHTSRLSGAEIARLTQATAFLQDQRLGRPVYVPPERVVTFQRAEQDFFSLVFVEAPALNFEPARLLRIILEFNRILRREDGGNQYPEQGYGQGRQGQSAAPGRPSGDQSQEGVLFVRRFSPNWTAGGASQGIGGGGPGARPVLPATQISPTGPTPHPWDITINGLNFNLAPDQRGDGVEVAILDTMPEQADIDAAYAKWNMTNPTAPTPNPLIDSLFQPNGRLRLSPGGFTHLLNLANFHVEDQPYVMVDHGTFIAGIVHSIAPKASIHLIEVLNPLGAGTLETIVGGFQRLVADRTKDGVIADQPPLVVNASLVLSVPSPTALADLAAQDPLFANIDAATLEDTLVALKAICDLLRPHNVYFVAAAGNDNKPTLPATPEADFPAALTGVVGVGALDKNIQPTDYTNVSDRAPDPDGLAVFGGIRAANDIDTDSTDGMLGIYTGVFPSPNQTVPNDQGWARWAGTSFAAPIISGAVAAVISDSLATGGTLPADPFQPLRDADLQPHIPVGDIVRAQQG